MLSKLRYFNFTESTLLSCWSCFLSCGFSFCLTSWIGLPHLSGLWSVFSPCADLHTTMKWFAYWHSPHLLPYTGFCLGRCPVPQYLQFSLLSAFYGPHCPFYVCHSLQSQIIWPLLCWLVLLSASSLPYLFGTITVPSHS